MSPMTSHSLTRAAVLAVAVAALQAAPAQAHTCGVTAYEPVMNIDGTATGRASFQCYVPNPGDLTIHVCVEVATLPSLWNTYGCTATTRTTGFTVFGSATAAVCSVQGGLLMRTTAYGISGAGYNDYGESNPAVVNCGVVN